MAPALSETLIREHASPESFHRGEEYERHGAVISLVRRGDVLQAEVEGSEAIPYRVRIDFDDGDVAAAECTCPFDWGGWCKHVVATLLTYLHRPETAQETPPLEESLAALDRDQLQALILSLVAHDPSLADVIESRITLAQVHAAGPPGSRAAGASSHPAPIDTQPFRRQVRTALHGLDHMRRSEAYWHMGSIVMDVGQVLEPVRSLVEAGDGRAALTILEAVTAEYAEGWTMLDDSEGELSDFFYALGPLWTEALLSADLTAAERERWVDLLTDWEDELADYGVDYVFEAAIEAARQGWDYPPLLRVLQGEATEYEDWEDAAPDEVGELAVARLNVLERQGRYQEYLYLADAEGQTERYATMLARLDRVPEAVAYGLTALGSADAALALAKVLLESGHPDEAIQIAEHGLTLQGPRVALAIWLRDVATSLGRVDRALPAAVVAFEEQPDLSTYRAVQALSGADWPGYRDELLSALRRVRSQHPAGAVDVFLQEGLYDDAITTVDGTWSYALIERVVEAVTISHPDWAIRASLRQAEPIMDRGDAQNYHHAARWLAHARAAYLAAGRAADWSAYLEGLIETHKRKYKLRPMLEALRT